MWLARMRLTVFKNFRIIGFQSSRKFDAIAFTFISFPYLFIFSFPSFNISVHSQPLFDPFYIIRTVCNSGGPAIWKVVRVLKWFTRMSSGHVGLGMDRLGLLSLGSWQMTFLRCTRSRETWIKWTLTIFFPGLRFRECRIKVTQEGFKRYLRGIGI